MSCLSNLIDQAAPVEEANGKLKAEYGLLHKSWLVLHFGSAPLILVWEVINGPCKVL